jgi:ParB family chromosome partitioning protein
MSKYGSLLGRFGTGAAEAAGARSRWTGCDLVGDAWKIPLERIDADPNQPRREFDEDELARLAASLKAHGQLQPIRVRYDETRERFVVIVGERRLRAARLAGLPMLTAIVDQTEQSARLEIQLIENLARADLKPMEEARAFATLRDTYGYSAKTLAERLGVSESKVSRSLALLELPEDTQDAVDEGEIRGAAIRELIRDKTRKPHKPKADKPTAKVKAKAAGRKEHRLRVDGAVVLVTLRKAGDVDAVKAALAAALEAITATAGKKEAA